MMISDDRSQTLSVTTCDKCGKIMLPGDDVIFVTDGKIRKFDQYREEPSFCVDSIRYACHYNCWDHYEDGYDEEYADILK